MEPGDGPDQEQAQNLEAQLAVDRDISAAESSPFRARCALSHCRILGATLNSSFFRCCCLMTGVGQIQVLSQLLEWESPSMYRILCQLSGCQNRTLKWESGESVFLFAIPLDFNISTSLKLSTSV